MQSILISGNTDVGKRRKDNQDAFICQPLWNDTSFLAVIDGVGGYAGGDKAAAIAKESMLQYMQAPKGEVLNMLREAVVFANNEIVKEKSNGNFASMCCVLTAVVADAKANKLYYVHVGDTRLYIFSNGKLKKITKDHSLVGIREDAGDLSEEEAMKHPQRNVILREVGSIIHHIDDPEFLEYGEHDFNYADTLLLCSDGLSDMISSQAITSVLSQKIDLSQKVASLIQLANNAGGNDNVTVVLGINNIKQKVAGFNKKITAEIPISLSNSLAANFAPVQESDYITTKTNKKKYSILLFVFLLAALIVVGIFYWMKKDPQKTMANPKNDSSVSVITNPSVNLVDTNLSKNNNNVAGPKNSVATVSVTLDSLNKFVFKVLGKMPDTLIVQKSDIEQFAFIMNKVDSSTHKTETLYVKNLKTGVVITSLVQAGNVKFENGIHPILFEVKADTGNHKAVVLINSKP